MQLSDRYIELKEKLISRLYCKSLLRDDPVLLVGMHHSGTSMMAKVLESGGIYMNSTIMHSESRFFTYYINIKMIMGVDGWANIPIMEERQVLSYEDKVKRFVDRYGYRIFLLRGYDGKSKWGFKDPRTCVLLPLYLRIFPRARILHILRDENKVAASLSAVKKMGVGRIEDTGHWIELRRQYISRVCKYGAVHRYYYEVDYESFCVEPVQKTQEIFDFLDIDFAKETEMYLQNNIYQHRI